LRQPSGYGGKEEKHRVSEVVALYKRIFPAMRSLPLLLLLPLAVEMLQHVVEIRLGFYDLHGALPPEARSTRLIFGIVKVAALAVTLVLALRWWAFSDQGEPKRALRPGLRFVWGLCLFLIIQVPTELAEDALENGLALVPALAATRLARAVIALGITTFVSGLWLAWSIGLLVEDRTLGFVRSVVVSAPRILTLFVYVLAGTLPLMVVHYALSYFAMGQADWIVWSANVIDAVVVCVLILAIASGFFSVYRTVRKLAHPAG
jgi:hypothetical protein